MPLRPGLLLACALLVVPACRPGDAAWRAELAASKAPRLVGLWDIRMVPDRQAGDPVPPPSASGEIALTLNEERQASPVLGASPMVVGTYNIDLAPLGLSGTYAGFPGVVGRTSGDSVDLRLAAESKLPIELRGRFDADSIVGRWDAHSRAGRGGMGDFVLRRR